MTPYSSGDTELRYRFASSIDANMRMNYQIGLFGVYGDMRVSYLWTKNYLYEQSHPAWLANLSNGVSFRF
jgi:hypothetical protein